MRMFLALFLVVIMTFSMVGCKTQVSDLVLGLNAVADASSVAVVVTSSLAGMGKLDPVVASQVAAYADEVNKAVNTSIKELNSSETNPQKIATITAAFLAASAPAFGPNVSPQVVAGVNAVAGAVKVFLSQLTSPTMKAVVREAPATGKVSLTSGDKATLKKIQQKVAETSAITVSLK